LLAGDMHVIRKETDAPEQDSYATSGDGEEQQTVVKGRFADRL
jgi:hypothetical protein